MLLNSAITEYDLNSLQETGLSDLTQAEIQEAINSANDLADQHRQSNYLTAEQ